MIIKEEKMSIENFIRTLKNVEWYNEEDRHSIKNFIFDTQSLIDSNSRLNSICSSKSFKGITNLKFQYRGLFWWTCSFKEEAKYLLKDKYKIYDRFLIMPYRFGQDDVVKAKLDQKAKRPPIKFDIEKGGLFYDEMIKNPSFVNFDGGTGNFHKKPDLKYQIVLVDPSTAEKYHDGPGHDNEADTIIKAIRNDMYFPKIILDTKESDLYKDATLDDVIELMCNCIMSDSIEEVKKIDLGTASLIDIEKGKPYKIWVDDLREVPAGYLWAKSVNEAIALIERIEQCEGEIDCLDLDHDLGDFARFGGDAIKLLDYLCERETFYPIKIHTANPVGRANMERMIERFWV